MLYQLYSNKLEKTPISLYKNMVICQKMSLYPESKTSKAPTVAERTEQSNKGQYPAPGAEGLMQRHWGISLPSYFSEDSKNLSFDFLMR